MQRSFSAELEEDREFEFGGETFRYRLFHWTETVEMLDTKLDDNLVINEDGSFSWRADTEFCLKEIPRFLETEDRAKFKKVVDRKTDPVPRFQIAELYVWLRGKVQALPTQPPSSEPLATGDGSNGNASSAASSSTEATSST